MFALLYSCAGGVKGPLVQAPPTDDDADGYASASVGGDDCDDSDPSIHPAAPELVVDGIDQDCDGADLGAGIVSEVGDDETGDFGVSVAGLGDVNGDGYADVGVQGDPAGGAHAAFVKSRSDSVFHVASPSEQQSEGEAGPTSTPLPASHGRSLLPRCRRCGRYAAAAGPGGC